MESRFQARFVFITLLIIILLPPGIGLFRDLSKTNTDVKSEAISAVQLKNWEYRWGDTRNYKIPETKWTQMASLINPPDRNGHKILWIRTPVITKNIQTPALLISGKGVLLTFEVYSKEEIIYKFGTLTPKGHGNISGITSHLIELGNHMDGEMLYFRIFSDYSNIGIRGKTMLGSKSDLILHVVKKESHQYMLGLFMILIGIIEIFSSRIQKERNIVISMFGILAISLGFYTISLTSIKDLLFFAPNFWFLVYICSMTVIPVGMIGFVWQTFRPSPIHFLKKIWQFHIFYALICQASFILALAQFISIDTGTYLLNILRLLLIVEMGLILCIVCKDSFRQKDNKARIYLAGFVPIMGAGVHDSLVGLGKFDATISFVPWGLMLFILSLEIIERFSNIKIQNTLRLYARNLEKAAKEKSELINDLHDGVGGLITNIKFLSQMGLRGKTIPSKNDSLSNIAELSKESMVEIGYFMQGLEEEDIQWSTIIDNFHHLGNTMIKPFGLNFTLQEDIAENAGAPDKIMFINLLRIYRESLTNITKHAKATAVFVSVKISPDRFRLQVKDDGIGFIEDINRGKGLDSMESRADKLGGKLTVLSKDGTTIRLEIEPIKRNQS